VANVFTETDPYILVPFAAYMIGVFVIAILAHRYLRRGDFEAEYYVGGRSFGAWVLAMSWVATLASGGSFLGYPSLIYSYGWSMAFWVCGSTTTALVGLGIVGKRINRLARQTGALTLVDLLRDRYRSQAVGVVYALVIVLVTTVYLVAQFVAGARILESMLGTSYQVGLVVFVVSVVAYTTYGGFRAVAWTDTLQGIVMIVGIVLLVPLAIHAAGGMSAATLGLATREDPAATAKGLPTARHAYLYPPGPEKITKEVLESEHPEPTPDPWLPIGLGISYFMLRSLGSVMMPTSVPRMLAFKDTRSLRRAMILLAPYFLLMYGSSMITMNCAHVLDLGLGPGESDRAVPELAKVVAPRWLAGILIAAPFAAVMSTVDSGLLVVSAAVVRDLVQKTFLPNLAERSTKRLSYAVTAGVGALVMLIAFDAPPFLQPLVIHYTGASVSALLWPSLATLYWRRSTATGVVSGLAGGLMVYVGCAQWPPLGGVLHPFVYGCSISGILCVVGSLATRPQSPDRLALYFGRPPEHGSRQ